MAQQKYNKAYEAYQQAVYRDGRNPTFWCSIGVLYYQINQYRDALDAYSRAIRLNPHISEVWYDLGTLVCSTLSALNFAPIAYLFRSTNPATIRQVTRWTLINAPMIWIQATPTSRSACNISNTRKLPGCQTKGHSLCRRTCSLKPTSQPESTVPSASSGTLLPRNRTLNPRQLRVHPRLPLVTGQVVIVWPKFSSRSRSRSHSLPR